MKKQPRPEIIRAVDGIGRHVVHVPALCGRTCRSLVQSTGGYARVTMDAADYDRIREQIGHDLTLQVNANAVDSQHCYVRLHLTDRGTRQIAHLVLQVRGGIGVSYVDGNPLNVRRANLMQRGGRSKGDTGALNVNAEASL